MIKAGVISHECESGDFSKRAKLYNYAFLFIHLQIIFDSVLKSSKLSKMVNYNRTLDEGIEFMKKMIGGMLLIKGEKDFSEFPLTSEGLVLAGYMLEAIKDLKLIERDMVLSPEFVQFGIKIHNTLLTLQQNSTAVLEEKEILLAREFFEYLYQKVAGLI